MLSPHITNPLSSLLKLLRNPSAPYAALKVVVRSKDGWYRGIFINNTTQKQVAVVTRVDDKDKVKLSIPIEGMGGWHTIISLRKAFRVASRETTFRGKLYNRTVFLPLSFLLHDLH